VERPLDYNNSVIIFGDHVWNVRKEVMYRGYVLSRGIGETDEDDRNDESAKQFETSPGGEQMLMSASEGVGPCVA